MIRVQAHRDGAITLHSSPHWLARLFGARDFDMEVTYGGGWWLREHDGRPVTWQENQAIEKAVGR